MCRLNNANRQRASEVGGGGRQRQTVRDRDSQKVTERKR